MVKLQVSLRAVKKKRRRQMIKIFLMNPLDQVKSNQKKTFIFFCWNLDEEIDEEDDTDNDHPGSDPDFGGNRRSTSPKLVSFPS